MKNQSLSKRRPCPQPRSFPEVEVDAQHLRVVRAALVARSLAVRLAALQALLRLVGRADPRNPRHFDTIEGGRAYQTRW